MPTTNSDLGAVRRGVREVGLALITAGVMILLFVLYQLVGTNFAEEHSQQQLAQQFQESLGTQGPPASSTTASTTTLATAHSTTTVAPATTTTLAPISPPPGGALAHLVIPKIGVDKYVVEGVAESDLEKGPGHYSETVLPGQLGNVAIAGHRTTYGAPFYRLNELVVGDPIYLTTTRGTRYTYLVTSHSTVDPSDVAVLDNTPTVAELTLTTCNPRFEATNRLVVVARLKPGVAPAAPSPSTTTSPKSITSPKTTTPVAVGAAAPDITLGSGNGSAWPSVLAYGALVVVGWVLVRLSINRTRRWARLGAYVVGIGICLIPLWFLFENVARLLPQNI
jgi:sortase A